MSSIDMTLANRSFNSKEKDDGVEDLDSFLSDVVDLQVESPGIYVAED